MTLNEIFRRTGEPTYHTPIAVIGELVKAAGKREKWQVDLTISEREQARTEFNQSGGQVTIINPPYHSQPRAWRKGWAKKLRIGRLYFYISNCRMKKRPIRDLMYTNHTQDHCIENKRKLYERQGGRCPHCGQPFEYEAMELHHVLPLARFPELGQSIRNGIMLCHKCHKEVHCNPWRNIEMMKAKAEELGIDLTERYKTGAVESEQECAPNDE